MNRMDRIDALWKAFNDSGGVDLNLANPTGIMSPEEALARAADRELADAIQSAVDRYQDGLLSANEFARAVLIEALAESKT